MQVQPERGGHEGREDHRGGAHQRYQAQHRLYQVTEIAHYHPYCRLVLGLDTNESIPAAIVK
jgi:hypothetical protein